MKGKGRDSCESVSQLQNIFDKKFFYSMLVRGREGEFFLTQCMSRIFPVHVFKGRILP